jgi:hypothetical protein
VEAEMSIEVMRQALEVLEQINQLSIGENAISLPGEIDAAMDNLRAAIEQAEKPRYRRGTYVRCMESDELCRVYTTSIDGGAWVKWPDGSITTYTAEQMGQAFSLEQAAPGKPVAYVDERIHGWPDCFVPMPDPPHTVPLYTEPREWVGLTDEEVHEGFCHVEYETPNDWNTDPDDWCQQFARYLEATLKEKNT